MATFYNISYVNQLTWGSLLLFRKIHAQDLKGICELAVLHLHPRNGWAREPFIYFINHKLTVFIIDHRLKFLIAHTVSCH